MGTWRTTVRYDYGTTGGPGYSTFHFRDDGDGGLEDALENAGDALRAAYALIRPQLPPATRITGEGRWVDVFNDDVVTTPVWTDVGTLASPGDYLPPTTAVVIGWRTGTAARSGRGRTFLSGFAEASNAATGAPVQAVLDAARAMGQSLVNFNGTLGNGAFVVYSPTRGIARDITGMAVRGGLWASLRSRRD